MVHAAVQDVRVIAGVDASGGVVVGGCVLGEEVDVFLGGGAGFVDGFGAFADALLELFLLCLDLVVEALEDG